MRKIHQAAKFFFEGERKCFLQGVAYGPFRPKEGGTVHLPEPERVREDFAKMRAIGINLVRLYHQPPEWFLDEAAQSKIRVLTTIPWPLRGLFLDDLKTRKVILENMRRAAGSHAGHVARLGFFVDNEMPADLVRWYGRERVQKFLNECISQIRESDPDALVSYAGYPPSESILPVAVDFYSFNVYLHERESFQRYLSRLHNLAGEKPVLLSEFGMDTIRHSQEEQAGMLSGYIEDCYRGGAAGAILFSWTDEWFTGGEDIKEWAFGLVSEDRKEKRSYHAVGQRFLKAGESVSSKYPLVNFPKVSVVVCTYNGAITLERCLRALEKQIYPDFEIIVVDDGSTDWTQDILKDFPGVKSIYQENRGLSAARNRGMEAAEGDVVAYTDSDCMPDEDWLYYLIQVLEVEGTAAVGGPNISPPAHQWVQAAVAAAPGSPSHVLFNDRRAEHVPGCNMAFWKWALEEIGGFDPVYRKAGDDVDVCWKLLDLGREIAFAPAAVVWHHRRFSVKAYFSQQRGYGEAEALLRFQHSNRFDSVGCSRWNGRIYGAGSSGGLFYRPLIYHGIFAMGAFQSVYARPAKGWLGFFGSLQWVSLMCFMFILSFGFSALRLLPLVMFGLTLVTAWAHMSSARIEVGFDGMKTRLLVFYLSLLQPLARAWSRYFTWLEGKRTPHAVIISEETLPHYSPPWWKCGLLEVWSQAGKERGVLLGTLNEILKNEGWRYVLDTGWSQWDIQIFANRWWHVTLRTQSEAHAHGACLTRVGVHLVPTSFMVLAGVVYSGVGLSLMMVVPVVIPLVYLWWLAALGFWLLIGMRVRRRVAETVLAATRREGMKRLEALERI